MSSPDRAAELAVSPEVLATRGELKALVMGRGNAGATVETPALRASSPW